MVENQQNQHIQPSMPADSGSSPSLLLSGLTRCIVTLPETARFSSAAIKDVADSVLILGTALEGPAHMTGIKNSVLVLGCRQFRMHEAENVEIYLRCGSKPIIEDCKGLRFAPFAGEEGNLWDQVEDFKWLREEKSPHWSVMEVNKRKGDWEMIGKEKLGSEETAKLLSELSPA